MTPLYPNARFFSSLKQVEKRLKLDNNSQPPSLAPPPPPSRSPPPVSETVYTPLPSESLSSPIYLNFDQPITSCSSSLQESSEQPPQEFVSDHIPRTQENPHQSEDHDAPALEFESRNGIDDIDLLMQLLGLSDFGGGEEKGQSEMPDLGDDEFYDKIVKVKGPKCKKEVERLDGWIKYFLLDGNGERREPLRLVHLLLAKAAFASVVNGGDREFEGLEFPSTVDEFLQNDPPSD